jgi:inositol phosphorylceramide mannosyltransferase catalytic subunit
VDSVIPKRIVQTARDHNLPLMERACVSSLRLLNADYEWRFFDDQDVEQFIGSECERYRRAFDGFTYPIQRYDFFRYLAIYRLGGFYFDLDVLLARDLSTLRPRQCVFPFEGLTFSRLLRDLGMDWEMGNYGFGATAGHPFLEAVIENCVRAQREPAWVKTMMDGVPSLSRAEHFVLYSTGPGLLSRTLAENPQLARTVSVLFPEDVCDEQCWNRFGDFGVHLMNGSWRPKRSVIRRRLALRCEAWVTKRLIRESRRRGLARHINVSEQGKARP